MILSISSFSKLFLCLFKNAYEFDCLRNSNSKTLKAVVFPSLEFVFLVTNIVDPYEMPQFALTRPSLFVKVHIYESLVYK